MIPPTPFVQSLKASQQLFDGLIYQSREATPAESVRFYLERRHAVALLWQKVRLMDYRPYPWVHPFYFLMHDLYHCADKTLAFFTVDDLIRPLWRALGKIPKKIIEHAGMQVVIRLVLDLEGMGYDNVNVAEMALTNVILPLRYCYVSDEVGRATSDIEKFELVWEFCKRRRSGYVEADAEAELENWPLKHSSRRRLEEYRESLMALIAASKRQRSNRQFDRFVSTLEKELSSIAESIRS